MLHASARNSIEALDVDTDNDGVLDAVWIDVGMPVQTDAEGRSFRPLVAYKVIDMDANLNLNVHGRTTEAYPITSGASFGTIADATPSIGLGIGVPEISLSEVFTDPTDGYDRDSYGELLHRRYAVGTIDSNIASDISDNLGFPGPARFKKVGSVNNGLGGSIVSAGVTQTKHDIRLGYLQWPTGRSTAPTTIFGTSGDTLGAHSFAFINPLRMPAMNRLAIPTFGDPREVASYASDFSVGGGASDNFYSATDMESLLRPYDSDTRLTASGRFSENVREHLERSVFDITTHSFEIDFGTTSLNVVDHLIGLLTDTAGPYGLSEVDAKLRINQLLFDDYDDYPADPANTPATRNHLNRLLSQDIFRGGRMGINIVPRFIASDPSMAYDPASNPIFSIISAPSKYEYAKQFYCLALIVCGMDTPPGSGLTNVEYRTAIAQWAINIVDFQDPDSIMTRFDFDLDPFDAAGWETDGDADITMYDPDGAGPSGQIMPLTPTDIAIVFGAERPELLITETFAHHERRTEDLMTDDGSDTDVAGGDNDWDSQHVPQSSAYFEIFNPWTLPNTSQITNVLAGEPDPAGNGEYLRDPSTGVITADGAGRVNISAKVSATDPDPVWRVAFKRARADTTFLRTLYFTDASTIPAAKYDAETVTQVGGGAAERFGTTLETPDAIERGDFLLVGSSGNVGTNGANPEHRTHFGRLSSGLDVDLTRGIGLVPGTDGTDDMKDGQIVLYNYDGTDTARRTPIDNVNVMVVNQPRSFSLSDPAGGYDLTGLTTMGVDDGTIITDTDQIRDMPFDADTAIQTDMSDRTAIATNGVTDNFRFAYLQRLADPTQPFEEDLNPYITVDSAAFDLLAFNGVVADNDNSNTIAADPDVTDGETDFRSWERGSQFNSPYTAYSVADVGAARRHLFQTDNGTAPMEVVDASNVPVALQASDDHNFSFNFVHSFAEEGNVLGALNRTYRDNGTLVAVPFSWFAFNNRPFMSMAEILNVPCLPPEKLTEYYNNPVAGAMPAAMTTLGATSSDAGDFRYTMKTGGVLMGQGANRFDRLFDYLEVPSLFSNYRYHSGTDPNFSATQTGSVRYIDINVEQEGGINRTDPSDTPNEQSGGVAFNSFFKGNLSNESVAAVTVPPFRRGLTDFRSPGKVNLNTLRTETVWTSVSNAAGPAFAGAAASLLA